MKQPTPSTATQSPARQPQRVIFVHHTYKRMPPEQLRAALSSVDADDPRIVAIEQLIDEELGDAMLSASDPNIDHTKGTHAGGRVDALATLKNRIGELRK